MVPTLTLDALRDALDCLHESVVICDAEDRIVYANRRFLQMNAAAGPAAHPGMSYARYLEAGAAQGLFPAARGREAAWLAAALARRRDAAPWPVEFERQDGTWLLANFARLPGGGSITFGVDITTRKRAEEAARVQTERLRLGQQTAGMLVMDWDIRRDALSWSDSPEWLRGPEPAGGYPLYRDQVHPEDRERWLAVRDQGIHTQARHEMEYRIVRTDGEERWVHSRRIVLPGPDGKAARMVVALLDITERKRAEAATRLAEERLRSALEHLAELICLTDSADRIVFANRSFIAFNAPVAAELAPGRPYEAHLRAGLALGRFPDAAGREEAWLAERLAQRRAPGGPQEVRRHDGRWLLIGDQRLPDGGTITFGLEITERKRAEAAMRDVNAELERRVGERTAALEAAYRELEAFSYSVSHDLRAPLRAVAGYAHIVREEEGARLSADGRRRLAQVESNAERMGLLIDALLTLVRSSRSVLAPRALDMAALARAACAELTAEHPQVRVDIGALPAARGDETLVRQVFVNLIGNAFKYAARAPGARVSVGADRQAGAAHYFVRDNGVGFDMAHAGRLFKPFERLHSEAEYPGTGIGLALTQLIVQRHGGRIWAESAPGRGATFMFTLPPAEGGE